MRAAQRRSFTDLNDQTVYGHSPVVRASQSSPELLSEEADAVVGFTSKVYECGSCGVSRPTRVATGNSFEDTLTLDCYGHCQGSTTHKRRFVQWEPVRLKFECEICGFDTLMFESPEGMVDGDLPNCPDCPPEPEGPDGIPVVPTDDVSVDDFPGAFDVTESVDELTEVSGVTRETAWSLIEAGIYSKADLRRRPMTDLSDHTGRALAARIKSDVGDLSEPELILTEVRLRGDLKD